MSDDLAPIRNWLLKLSTIVTCSFGPDELATRIGMLASLAAIDFPPAAFCDRSLHAALRKLTFWPSYAELVGVLEPWWAENRPDKPNRYALPPLTYDRPQQPPERSPEEIAHASRLVAEVTAALRHDATERGASCAKATPDWRKPPAEMTRAQLNEAYRRAGVKGPAQPMRHANDAA